MRIDGLNTDLKILAGITTHYIRIGRNTNQRNRLKYLKSISKLHPFSREFGHVYQHDNVLYYGCLPEELKSSAIFFEFFPELPKEINNLYSIIKNDPFSQKVYMAIRLGIELFHARLNNKTIYHRALLDMMKLHFINMPENEITKFLKYCDNIYTTIKKKMLYFESQPNLWNQCRVWNGGSNCHVEMSIPDSNKAKNFYNDGSDRVISTKQVYVQRLHGDSEYVRVNEYASAKDCSLQFFYPYRDKYDEFTRLIEILMQIKSVVLKACPYISYNYQDSKVSNEEMKHEITFHTDDKEGRSQLHLAAHCGSIKDIKRSIESGILVDAVDNLGRTALHLAILWGNSTIVEYLIVQYKASLIICDKLGNNIFHIAANGNNPYIINYCIRHVQKDSQIDIGVFIQAKNLSGETPLDCASKNKNIHVGQRLKTHCSLVEIRNKPIIYPKSYAAFFKDKSAKEGTLALLKDYADKGLFYFHWRHHREKAKEYVAHITKKKMTEDKVVLYLQGQIEKMGDELNVKGSFYEMLSYSKNAMNEAIRQEFHP